MASEIVLSPAHAGNAQVIAVEDECYRRVGLTTQAPTHTDEDIDEEFGTCEDCRAPCDCPPGLPALPTLEVVGFEQISFATCPDTTPHQGGAWDGKLQRPGPGACNWFDDPPVDSVNGYEVRETSVQAVWLTDCAWTLQVSISAHDEEEQQNYAHRVTYRKSTGGTPLGTYHLFQKTGLRQCAGDAGCRRRMSRRKWMSASNQPTTNRRQGQAVPAGRQQETPGRRRPGVSLRFIRKRVTWRRKRPAQAGALPPSRRW